MNQMATFCLGERAHPLWLSKTDQAQATKNLFCLIMYLIPDLWPLWIASTLSSTLDMTASTTSSPAWVTILRTPGARWPRHFGSYPYMPINGCWIILTDERHTGYIIMWFATVSFGWPSWRPMQTDPNLGTISMTPREWRGTWRKDKPPCCGWGIPLTMKGNSSWH